MIPSIDINGIMPLAEIDSSILDTDIVSTVELVVVSGMVVLLVKVAAVVVVVLVVVVVVVLVVVVVVVLLGGCGGVTHSNSSFHKLQHVSINDIWTSLGQNKLS